MENPIMQALNKHISRTNLNLDPKISSFLQMASLLKNSSNPNQMAKKLLSSNPEVASFICQNGGNPEKAFYQLTKTMGIDPSSVLKMFKQ